MVQIVLDDHVYLIGKAEEVLAEMERIAAFAKYGIGWKYQAVIIDRIWN